MKNVVKHHGIHQYEKCQSDADCYSQACDSHNFCQDKKVNEKCSNQ